MLEQREKRSVEEGFTHVPNSLRDELLMDEELRDTGQKEEQSTDGFTEGNRVPQRAGKLPKEHIEIPIDFTSDNC